METKVCSKCKTEKEICEFYKRKETKDGHRSDCKCCFNERALEYRKNNEEKIKRRSKDYFQKNKQSHLEKKQIWRNRTTMPRFRYMGTGLWSILDGTVYSINKKVYW